MSSPTPSSVSKLSPEELSILPKTLPLELSLHELPGSIDTWLTDVRGLGDVTVEMAERAKRIAERMIQLAEARKARDEEFGNMYGAMHCDLCTDIYRDPHTFPCGHSFCGECLENLWRPQLNERIETTHILGHSVKDFLNNTVKTEIEFQMRLADLCAIQLHEARELVTYESPCCQQPITRPPALDTLAKGLCAAIAASLKFDIRPPHRDSAYFSKMFMLG